MKKRRLDTYGLRPLSLQVLYPFFTINPFTYSGPAARRQPEGARRKAAAAYSPQSRRQGLADKSGYAVS